LTDPRNPQSSREGMGLFNSELYLLSCVGVDLRDYSPAGLLTARYLVDSILPFILLFGASWLTKPTDPRRVARFYARMKTPVEPDPAADALAVEESYAHPTRFDHTKIFPRSNWEFGKWTKLDALGFIGVCASVVIILLIFKAVMVYGR
jgi:SSS family solute:Na+ symporter